MVRLRIRGSTIEAIAEVSTMTGMHQYYNNNAPIYCRYDVHGAGRICVPWSAIDYFYDPDEKAAH